MTVVSLTDIVPPARYDGTPWTTATVGEGATAVGTFTTIATTTLSPVDGDPSQPQSRNLTVTTATLTNGFYVLTFSDAIGNTSQPSSAIQNVETAFDGIAPTVAELGAFMRARTVAANTGGTELGTFTAATRPTAEEAELALEQAVDMVLMAVGSEIPVRLYDQTRQVVKLYAAMLVEVTFYRNEVNKDQSAFEQYQTLYGQALIALTSALSDTGPASPAPAFWSVPVLNAQQSRFQSIVNAYDENGNFDPSKLPPDMWYPVGPGGIPANFTALWPWLGDSPFAGGGFLTDLEADG